MTAEYFYTADRAIAVGRLGSTNYVVYGPNPWTDASWAEHLDHAIENHRKFGTPTGALGYVAHTTPTAAQRRFAIERVSTIFNHPAAIVTASGLARAGINGIALLLRMKKASAELRAFRPDDFSQAVTWLQERGETLAAVAMTEMCAELLRGVGYKEPAVQLILRTVRPLAAQG